MIKERYFADTDIYGEMVGTREQIKRTNLRDMVIIAALGIGAAAGTAYLVKTVMEGAYLYANMRLTDYSKNIDRHSSIDDRP